MWDLGIVMWDIKYCCTIQAMHVAIVSSSEENYVDENNNNDLEYARTYFDAHENTVVLGKNYHATNCTGRTAEVQPFPPEHKSLYQVPIVDAAMQHDDPCTGEIYLLVFKNSLCVPAMTHNLVPPFLLREAGLIVDDVPKSQASTPTKNHHSMCFP